MIYKTSEIGTLKSSRIVNDEKTAQTLACQFRGADFSLASGNHDHSVDLRNRCSNFSRNLRQCFKHHLQNRRIFVFTESVRFLIQSFRVRLGLCFDGEGFCFTLEPGKKNIIGSELYSECHLKGSRRGAFRVIQRKCKFTFNEGST